MDIYLLSAMVLSIFALAGIHLRVVQLVMKANRSEHFKAVRDEMLCVTGEACEEQVRYETREWLEGMGMVYFLLCLGWIALAYHADAMSWVGMSEDVLYQLALLTVLVSTALIVKARIDLHLALTPRSRFHERRA